MLLWCGLAIKLVEVKLPYHTRYDSNSTKYDDFFNDLDRALQFNANKAHALIR
jgi:hypothetical protein